MNTSCLIEQNQITLRVASYNLQKCVGLDMRRRPDRVLEVLEDVDPDIAVLQEADKRIAPRPTALPFEMIRAAGWRAVPLAGTHASLGWHGNAILLRPGLRLLRTERLPLPGLEPRGAVLAEIETALGALRIVGVHLGLVRRYRVLQLHEIAQRIADLPGMPTLIAGDFNEWRRRTALLPERSGFTVHVPGPSYPAARPLGALDRFATCPRLAVQAAAVHGHRPAHIASDHRPVWAEIRRTGD